MFKRIPNFPSYEISKTGEVRRYLNKTAVKVFVSHDDCAAVAIRNEDGAGLYSIPELMLYTFVGEPPKYKPSVIALDGDYKNLQVANFAWGRRRSAPAKGKQIQQHHKPDLKRSDDVDRNSIRDRYFVDEAGVIWLRTKKA